MCRLVVNNGDFTLYGFLLLLTNGYKDNRCCVTKRIPCCHSSGQSSIPASQVPFPSEPSGEPSGEPGNGTWRAETTRCRRNGSVGFFVSSVTIILLQKTRTKTSFAFVLSEFIVCYDHRRACATNYWPITDVISKPKVKVVEHDMDGLSHVWCHPPYFLYICSIPQFKSSEKHTKPASLLHP